MKTLALAVLLSTTALACAAEEAKRTPNDICPEGQALTYTVQCDPGTRSPVERIWNPAGAGFEFCRVHETRCEPIPQFNPAHRPDHAVLDSPSGSTAIVNFGVGRVMGFEP